MIVPVSSPAVRNAVKWLRSYKKVPGQIIIFDQFELYFKCKIITSDSAFWDPISIEFDNEIDATMFLLKWS
jgi:hypothetical protein